MKRRISDAAGCLFMSCALAALPLYLLFCAPLSAPGVTP